MAQAFQPNAPHSEAKSTAGGTISLVETLLRITSCGRANGQAPTGPTAPASGRLRLYAVKIILSVALRIKLGRENKERKMPLNSDFLQDAVRLTGVVTVGIAVL
jgi:hypothetical protein